MLHKVLVCISFIVVLLITGCSDSGGKWVGEVFASPNSRTSTVIGEFGSYTECIEATQKEARSGVFNCGVKTD